MTQAQLELLKFKKITEGSYHWFERVIGKHKFITNDSLYNGGKDEWHIGYDNTSNNEDTFWFNNKLDSVQKFVNAFEILTGKLYV